MCSSSGRRPFIRSGATFTRDKYDIAAWFAALEVSIDYDWIRMRASGLFTSGDDSADDHTAHGFDAIQENPLFAATDTSRWGRQSIPLLEGGQVG